MPGLCGCAAPSFDGSMGDDKGQIPWYCINCGTLVPEDEELPDPSIQEGIEEQTAQRTSLNLSWPLGHKYIDDDDETTKCVIDILGSIEYGPDQKSVLPHLDDKVLEDKVPSSQHNTRNGKEGDKLYPYQSLHQAKYTGERSHFRVLKLSPGRAKDPLHGTLTLEALDSAPEYEAVSYTWADENGDTSRRRPLYLEKPWYRLAITNSCDAALRRFRDIKEPRYLWVDSICINQEDVDERQQQVELMPEIYSRAHKVLVYLGEGSESTSKAMFALNLDRRSFWAYQDGSSRSSIQTFFSLPYFTRVWIIQELALARGVHFFHAYDKQSLELYHARERVQEMFRETSGQAILPLWLQHCGKQKLFSWQAVVDLVFNGGSSRSTLGVDKVFAFFGMINGAIKEGLVADYQLTTEQVYTGISSFLISKGYLMDFLKRANCGKPPEAADGVRDLALPSWVTDFRRDTPWKELDLSPEFRPVYIDLDPYNSETQSGSVGVLKQTGSLVIYGHRLIGVHLQPNEKTTEDYRCRFGNREARIRFYRPFDPETDTVLIPCIDNPESFSLHLRQAGSPNHGNCHYLVGLCKVGISVPQGSDTTDSRIPLLGNWPIAPEASGSGSAIANTWIWYKYLSQNPHFPCAEALIAKSQGEPLRRRDMVPSYTRGMVPSYMRDRISVFEQHYEPHDFLEILETIREKGLTHIPPYYDKLWIQWRADHDASLVAAEEFVKEHAARAITDFNDQHVTNLQERISQWRKSTAKMIGDPSLSQDYLKLFEEPPEVNHFSGVTFQVRNVNDVEGMFDSFGETINRIVREGLEVGYAGSLIGWWGHFERVMSRVPRGGTVTSDAEDSLRELLSGSFFRIGLYFDETERASAITTCSPKKEKVIII